MRGKLLRGSLRAHVVGSADNGDVLGCPVPFPAPLFSEEFSAFSDNPDELCPIVVVNNPACVEVSVLRATDNVAAPCAGERPVAHVRRHDLIASGRVEGPLGATG